MKFLLAPPMTLDSRRGALGIGATVPLVGRVGRGPVKGRVVELLPKPGPWTVFEVPLLPNLVARGFGLESWTGVYPVVPTYEEGSGVDCCCSFAWALMAAISTLPIGVYEDFTTSGVDDVVSDLPALNAAILTFVG